MIQQAQQTIPVRQQLPIRKEAWGPVDNADSPWWGVAGAGLGGVLGASMTRSWWGPVLGMLAGWLLGGKAPTWWNNWWTENNITPTNPRTGEVIQPTQSTNPNPEGVNPAVEGVRPPDTAIQDFDADEQQIIDAANYAQMMQGQPTQAQSTLQPAAQMPDDWEQQMIEEENQSRMMQALEAQAAQAQSAQQRWQPQPQLQFQPQQQPVRMPETTGRQQSIDTPEAAALRSFRTPSLRELQEMYTPEEVAAFTAQQGPWYLGLNPQQDMYEQSAIEDMRGGLAAEQRRSDQAQYQNMSRLQSPGYQWNDMQETARATDQQQPLRRAFQSSMFSTDQLPWNQTQRRLRTRNQQQDLTSSNPADSVRNRNRQLTGER